MNCNRVRRCLSAFLDNEVERGERARISQHLASCLECGDYRDELESLRAIVRELPAVASPARLKTELQVIASRQKTRRTWRERVALALHNFMRPLAVPAAARPGGRGGVAGGRRAGLSSSRAGCSRVRGSVSP